MLSSGSRFLTRLLFLTVVAIAGLVTWLCVHWFAEQSPLTVMISVVLVELFLASVGVIAILLTERMAVTLLDAEKRPPAEPTLHRTHTPLWLRLSDTPPLAPPAADDPSDADCDTIAFPIPEDDAEPHTSDWLGRAA